MDLDELYRLSRPRKPPCSLAPVLAQLSKAERAQWDAALEVDVHLITNQALASWLERHVAGSSVNWQAARTHRRRQCACFDD